MLHYETIEPNTLQLLKRLQALPELANTRLVGGTALALQLGHRISVDLDLFGRWNDDVDFKVLFASVGHAEKSSSTPNGKMQFYYIDDIKVDCVTYDMYQWIGTCVEEDDIRLADLTDIAAMKINAITNRGTRKDFIDLFFLIRQFPFADIMRFYQRKYPDANLSLALRSMVYFVDAESQPMPKMLVSFDWEECKREISSAVRKFVTSI